MQEKIFGKVTNGHIDTNAMVNNFYDDSKIFILLDGVCNDKSYIKKIKQLYFKYGEEFLKKIDDFISIYLYDKKNNILILSRDRMGLKSVYYCFDNENIFFANDIKLLTDNFKIKKEINIKSLSMYFRCHYINPPETIFNNVYKLGHGHYIIYKNKKIIEKKYWDEIEQYNVYSRNKIRNKKQVKQELDALLSKNIIEFLRTKENFGIFLSGGIDSTLVTALCKKYFKGDLQTYSIGFYDNETNEAEKSKKIAKFLNTKHHELYISKEKIIDVVKKIPKYYTEPFGDCSSLPTIILNEYACEHNIKIAFTGDGADQLFCGSKVYDNIYKLQLAHKFLNPFNIHLNFKNKKLMYLYGNTNKKCQSQYEGLLQDRILKNLFVDSGCKRFEQESEIKSKNWNERRMILDIGTFMADRVCIKMGIASRNNGIEIRTPFLCKDVIEYSFKIPHSLKYHNKIKKYILKEILYDYVPRNFLSERKCGFGIPTKKWLKTYFFKDLKRVSKKSFIQKQDIFNYEKIVSLLDNIDNSEFTQVIWDFYMFQLWYCEHITK